MMKYKPIICSLIILAITLVSGCGKEESRAPEKQAIKSGIKLENDNVLLITLDTTRADRIGSYGYDKAITPTLDALAKRGSQFDQAFSQVNLTLPSHSSILTGRYPRELGVLVNGQNALGDSYPTLATVFKGKGYNTAAFVASFVLDDRFGLGRGFDVYDDDMGVQDKKEVQPMEWQVSGDLIVDRALKWLNTKKDNPFFCWVHFYDAHDPHEFPKGYKREGVPPYSGEITFVDAQIKRITDWLSTNHLIDRTLVVVVGDHGESFGEHGERGHTNFLYETNLHVPYLFAHPKVIPQNHNIKEVVELVDVFPTILDLFGMDIPDTLASRSLIPAFDGRGLESRPSYGESQYVFNSFGWAEQRSLTTSRWKYISTTKPELYDRQADPGETKNLIAEQPVIAKNLLDALKTIYNSLTPGTGSTVTFDAQTAKQLASLGYTSTAAESKEFITPGLSDPKDMNDVMIKYQMARELLKKADTKQHTAMVIPLLYDLTAGSPNSTMFGYLLGRTLVDIDEPEQAIIELKKVLAIDNTQVHAYIAMGDAYMQLDNKAEALINYELALKINESSIDKESESRTHERLGKLALEIGDANKALTHYQQALTIKPDVPENQYNMGYLLLLAGQTDKSLSFFQEAIRLKPDYGEAIINLGTAFQRLGNLDAADQYFLNAMKLEDVASRACYNYALILEMKGRKDESIPYLRRSIEIDPTFDAPYTQLVSYYFHTNQFMEAKKILEQATKALPKDLRFLSTLAKLLSTHPDAKIRDGKQAIYYALQAMPLTGNQHPVIMQHLASAYAEDGQFDKALEISSTAIRNAEGQGNDELAEKIRTQQNEYKAGRPYRNSNFAKP